MPPYTSNVRPVSINPVKAARQAAKATSLISAGLHKLEFRVRDLAQAAPFKEKALQDAATWLVWCAGNPQMYDMPKAVQDFARVVISKADASEWSGLCWTVAELRKLGGDMDIYWGRTAVVDVTLPTGGHVYGIQATSAFSDPEPWRLFDTWSTTVPAGVVLGASAGYYLGRSTLTATVGGVVGAGLGVVYSR